MKNELKISIVTPVYNSVAFIKKCMDSIKGQIYKNYEHIIVDGGSTDGTVEILKEYEGKYPMRWISEPDEGMYDAINKGFSMAEGKIFCWLNSDDYYFPWTLHVVSQIFATKKIAWLTGVPSNTKEYKGVSITYLLPNLPVVFCRRMIRQGYYDGRIMHFIQQESCFWSRELWKKSGGIDKNLKLAGDYFLWKKFAEYARLYTVHCNLASFYIHENQKSADINAYYREIGKKRCVCCRTAVQGYAHIYALVNYKKYVINLDEVMSKEG